MLILLHCLLHPVMWAESSQVTEFTNNWAQKCPGLYLQLPKSRRYLAWMSLFFTFCLSFIEICILRYIKKLYTLSLQFDSIDIYQSDLYIRYGRGCKGESTRHLPLISLYYFDRFYDLSPASATKQLWDFKQVLQPLCDAILHLSCEGVVQ